MLSKTRALKPTLTQIRFATTTYPPQPDYMSCNDIPGPPAQSIWQFIKSLRSKHGQYHVRRREMADRYGPIVKIKAALSNRPSFIINDPDLVEDLLRQDSKTPIRPYVPMWNHATDKLKAADGLLKGNGETWYRMRTVTNQKFMKQKAINEYFPEMDQVASDYIKRLESLRDEKKIIHNIADETFNWALESIGTVLVEQRLGCINDNRSPESNKFLEAVREMLETTAILYNLSPTMAHIIERKAYKLHIQSWATMSNFVEKRVHMRSKEIEHKNVEDDEPVSLIEYMVASNKLSEKEIIANITELMSGAVDTTSHAIQFLLHEVAKNSEVQDKLYQEIQEHIGSEKVITHEMVNHMSYLKAVIKETLRLHPAVFSIAREMSSDIVLNGYLIPKGTNVSFTPYVLGRQKTHFDEPDKFYPERWLRSNKNKEKTHSFAYLPFGLGPRGCVGRRIAEAEMYIVVSKIFQRFRLELVDNEPMKIECFLTLSPAKPLKFHYHDRI